MKLIIGHREWTFWLMLILTMSFSLAETDPRDVYAINSLYAALGSPLIPGWVPLGGDPCMEAWQGVLCVNSNITGISLTNANLEGQLGTELSSFSSIISIDFSNNRIGGTIPANLPPTLKTFVLTANQFTGSIPDLSTLSQLTDVSLSKNNLTGQIPDSFQLLTGLVSLDFSANNLTGSLPASMGNLSSLTTLRLQDNELSGVLDVLQDLPLTELNVERNQFSGPIPPKLLTIPDFRTVGNPFNTSVLPSPPASSPTVAPSTSLPGVLPPPGTHENTTVAPETSSSTKSATSVAARRTILAAAVIVFILLVVVLGLWFGIARWCKRRQAGDKSSKVHLKVSNEGKGDKQKNTESLSHNQINKGSQETLIKIPDVINIEHKQVTDVKQIAPVAVSKDAHSIDMTGSNVSSISAKTVRPPQHISNENITLKPVEPTTITTSHISTFTSSVTSFTVASLQQYTNSFSQDNLIGEGELGSVYRAVFPDGRVVAVKKLKNSASKQQSEDEFAQLISLISKIQHENVVKLVGYCSEYGQRLIVYAYCNNATLYDALYLDDEIHKNLSWSSRLRVALGAAKALEYLHEECQPPVVHKNFKSSNILLDDKLEPLISDSGLAPLLSDPLSAQSSSGYGAPELELGTYTRQSDVFSFGVVMLELLTGRIPYDSARPRGEQYLVRWAIPQLHDIDALSKMVDPSLEGSYPSKSLSRFADIISLCVQAEPEFRPPMSEIVQDLLNMIQRES